jgi:hypothetical protein
MAKDNRDKDGENGIDIFKWLNFVTFDVVTDLAFGESFKTVETGEITNPYQILPMNLTLVKESRTTGSR